MGGREYGIRVARGGFAREAHFVWDTCTVSPIVLNSAARSPTIKQSSHNPTSSRVSGKNAQVHPCVRACVGDGPQQQQQQQRVSAELSTVCMW